MSKKSRIFWGHGRASLLFLAVIAAVGFSMAACDSFGGAPTELEGVWINIDEPNGIDITGDVFTFTGSSFTWGHPEDGVWDRGSFMLEENTITFYVGQGQTIRSYSLAGDTLKIQGFGNYKKEEKPEPDDEQPEG